MHVKKTILALAAAFLVAHGAGAAETYRWDTVAMGGAGFVSGVVASKSERGVVFVRTDVGGAYRYDPQNERWVGLNDWLSEDNAGLMGVESLAIDPRNAANVYMLAGTSYYNSGKSAILRSTDYGKTFTTIDVTAQFKSHGNGAGRANGEKLQVDPGSSNVLFVGTRQNGLFKSVDSGATWNRVDSLNITETPNGAGISFVLLDPTSVKDGTARRIYVGVSRYGSVGPNLYLSKDGGATFAPIAGAPAGLMPHRAAITNKGRLYLTYGNGAGPHSNLASEPLNTGAIWEYNTIGGAWTNVTPAGQTAVFSGISVDPTNPKRLVATTSSLFAYQTAQPANMWGDLIFTSIDGGRNWTNLMQRGMSVDTNGIGYANTASIHWAGAIEFDPFDPKTAWVISGNGVYKTTDIDAPKSVWKFDVKGIEESGAYQAESIPGGPLVSIIGDYDGFSHTDPSQYVQRHMPAMGSTTGLAVAAQATHVMARVGNELYTSTTQGTTWEKAPTKMATRGNLALSADGFVLLHSPENSTTTYRSTDFGANWTPVAGLSVNNARPVADAVNPAKFYVYDRPSGKLFASTDGGVSFSLKSQLSNWGSDFVRATPGREGDLWMCMEWNGLAHSTDSGTTFTKVGAINSCSGVGLGKAAPDASYPTLYLWGAVNDKRGLMRSIDQGVSWDRVNDDTHQFGGFLGGRFVTGDMNTYGTVYMAANGRGIVYGKIDPAGDVQVTPQTYAPPPPPPKLAECKYVVTSTWWGGGIGEVRITNQSTSVISGWTVNWTYADNSAVEGFWNAAISGTKPTFTATNSEAWNHNINPNQTVSFGFVFNNGGVENPGPAPAVTGDICK